MSGRGGHLSGAAPALLLAVGLGAVGACKPDLDERTFAIVGPRVLAVRSDPAEAAPGATVTLSALYVDARGDLEGPFSWDFCQIRKPLAELGPASPRCTMPGGGVNAGDFLPLGSDAAVAGVLPTDGCRQFGPEAPASTATEPAGRPVDPDPTGGFYQPVRLLAGDQAALGRVRITCGVAGATADQVAELNRGARANTNPALLALTEATRGPLPPRGPGVEARSVSPGERLSLEATWARCDESGAPCGGSEAYAAFDLTTHQVVPRREAMRVSWFATGGTFDEDHTGRDPSDPSAASSNGWVAPGAPGPVHVWVVLRDDRGGVGWEEYAIQVE